jgi:hypothetical protein
MEVRIDDDNSLYTFTIGEPLCCGNDPKDKRLSATKRKGGMERWDTS